jgi:hypothetical protein
MSLPPGIRIKSLTGRACPHCGGTRIGWSWLTWMKGILVISTAGLAFALTVWLPVLRRCRDCGLVFRAPHARLFR